MSNATYFTIQELIDMLLGDYVTSCRAAPFDSNIVISSNMEQSYKSVLGTRIGKNPCPHNIESYHGLTLPPVDDNQTFTILINARYVDPSMRNIDWISTLIHEITHVYDFKEYFNIVSPKTFDELFDDTLHPIFNNWTEFHAMAVGHYYLRKYAIPNFKSTQHIDTILHIELPTAAYQMSSMFGTTNNIARIKYIVVRFLARLAVWQYLFPVVFNDSYITQIMAGNPWMEDLFRLLTKYPTLDSAYPHFDEIQSIWETQF